MNRKHAVLSRRGTILLSAFLITMILAPLWAAEHDVFQLLPFNALSPEGWQRNFLLKQRNGLTGHLDELCEPFNVPGIWAGSKERLQGPKYRLTIKGKEYLDWGWFESAGSYYDGVTRCGLLLNDPFLLDKAKKQIYGTIAEASPDGVMVSEMISRWPHVNFLRAFMALYEATGDRKILEAMERHYTHDSGINFGHAREIFNIEQLVWLYGQTGKRCYLDRSVTLYESESRGRDKNVNIFPDLASGKRQDVHGVTYHESLKNPIILYMATGEQKYLEAVRNGYAKVDRYSMLPDGMPSTEEGLSAKTALSCHETCDISSYIWTTLYLFRATGEVQWADRIERAALNAGLGAVTKEFDAYQYFSCLNQVHLKVGGSMSPINHSYIQCYAQRHSPQCCSGEVNRMLTNYFGSQWMRGHDNALVKVFYGPGSCVFHVNGHAIKVREDSAFPFSDTVKLTVTEGQARFPLLLRIPGWAQEPTAVVNGQPVAGVVAGQFLRLDGEHKAGDTIVLRFPRQVRFQEFEMNGMVVDYGPLLFALPITAKSEKKLLNKNYWYNTPSDVPELFAYDLEAASKWNYVLGLDEKNRHYIEVVENPQADLENPWNPARSPLAIKVYGFEFKEWLEMQTYKKFVPFYDKKNVQVVPVTPALPPRGCMTMVTHLCGKPDRITLVPYGSTTLRLTVFPYWNLADVPSFTPPTR